MISALSTFLALALIASTSAKRVITISVGGNTAGDASKVFQPQSVQADQGDVVYFNFTLGNHTVTQSLFTSPCLWTHASSYTLNGFDSGFRNAGNGTGFSDMLITVLDPNTPMWFFDYNTCAQGGVGVINAKSSGNETLDNFQNNAMNINGTGVRPKSNDTSAHTSSSAPPAQTRASNGATRIFALGISAGLPLVILALSF